MRQLQLVLVLALELQLVEFLPLVALRLRELELLVGLEQQRLVQLGLLKLVALRLRELRPLELLGFAPGLLAGFELQREPLEFEPALGLGLLQELRQLELMRLPGLEVRQLRLVIELELQLALELKLVELQVVELLRQE